MASKSDKDKKNIKKSAPQSPKENSGKSTAKSKKQVDDDDEDEDDDLSVAKTSSKKTAAPSSKVRKRKMRRMILTERKMKWMNGTRWRKKKNGILTLMNSTYQNQRRKKVVPVLQKRPARVGMIWSLMKTLKILIYLEKTALMKKKKMIFSWLNKSNNHSEENICFVSHS